MTERRAWFKIEAAFRAKKSKIITSDGLCLAVERLHNDYRINFAVYSSMMFAIQRELKSRQRKGLRSPYFYPPGKYKLRRAAIARRFALDCDI